MAELFFTKTYLSFLELNGTHAPQENTVPKSQTSQSILLVEKPFRCSKCGANFSSMRNKMQHDLLHAKRTSGFEQRGECVTFAVLLRFGTPRGARE